MINYSFSSDDIGFIQGELNGTEQLLINVLAFRRGLIPEADRIDLECAMRSLKNIKERITEVKVNSLQIR